GAGLLALLEVLAAELLDEPRDVGLRRRRRAGEEGDGHDEAQREKKAQDGADRKPAPGVTELIAGVAAKQHGTSPQTIPGGAASRRGSPSPSARREPWRRAASRAPRAGGSRTGSSPPPRWSSARSCGRAAPSRWR